MSLRREPVSLIKGAGVSKKGAGVSLIKGAGVSSNREPVSLIREPVSLIRPLGLLSRHARASRGGSGSRLLLRDTGLPINKRHRLP